LVITDDPEHSQLLRYLEFKSYIVVPVLLHGEVIGAIALIFRESDRRYSSAHLSVAKELARRAATAIENARLYSGGSPASRTRGSPYLIWHRSVWVNSPLSAASCHSGRSCRRALRNVRVGSGAPAGDRV
jgi:hypothetical protein